ncbi:MAG TPA: PTS mannitol transporter subunit IIABC [Firmicutes bacterium]|nr:PTS mannitol transporter subunit IIABC [Bacillota bacterium]
MSQRLFVTGELASQALKDTLARMPVGFGGTVVTLNISVAALMNTEFLCRNLPPCQGYSEVVLPGLCRVNLEEISRHLGVPAVQGPRDLKDLPAFYGEKVVDDGDEEPQVPKILAEIVDAPYLTTDQIRERARYYWGEGADIIDLGSCVEREFPHLEEVIVTLKEEGFRVSLDSFREEEIIRAGRAGVDMILSLNSSNLHLARHLSCPAVVIPDFGQGLDSLAQNAAAAEKEGASIILDPILDPLNFGFTASLHRIFAARRRYPDKPFLMGIGNVTELTDADSTGINALLMGVAVELGIDYVLTTEASPRTRGAVREAALARRLIHRAKRRGSPPKNLSDDLITCKDRRLETYSPAELKVMQQLVTDRNFRIFTAEGKIHIFNRDIYLTGTRADDLFSQLEITDPGHAYYLGRELYKAQLALQLGKKYQQEQELVWGYLSIDS